MPQGGGQSQQKRRTKGMNTGGPEPLLYPSGAERAATGPQTDGYRLDEGLMDDAPRPHTSVVRLDSPQTTQSQRLSPAPAIQRRQPGPTKNAPRQPRFPGPKPSENQKKSGVHWLLPLGVGMLAMLALWVTGSWVLAWGVQRYNDIRYGIPRTYQVDAIVGHNGDGPQHPSHFIAVNYNRQVIITEFPAGDPSKAVVYVAPVYIAGDGGDLAPVTLEFRDVNGDGKPDMLIHIHLPSQDQLSVFINDGGKFRPVNGNDKIRI
jgi:hypothetical protein